MSCTGVQDRSERRDRNNHLSKKERLLVGKAQRLTTFRPFGRPWVGTSVSPVPLFFDHAPCDLQECCRAEFGLPFRSAFFHHAFEAGPDYR